MSTQLVSVFLTPKQNDPNEAEVKVFPDEVVLFINVDEDESGGVTGIDIDDVFWQYFTVPPVAAEMPTFPASPQPKDVYVEVKLAPRNTPFGSSSSSFSLDGGSVSAANVAIEEPIDGDTATYGSNGINPLVPNKPRVDAAPPPTEQQLTASSEATGAPQNYKYAVVLTTATQVYTLDPKLIVIRRHRRSRSDT